MFNQNTVHIGTLHFQQQILLLRLKQTSPAKVIADLTKENELRLTRVMYAAHCNDPQTKRELLLLLTELSKCEGVSSNKVLSLLLDYTNEQIKHAQPANFLYALWCEEKNIKTKKSFCFLLTQLAQDKTLLSNNPWINDVIESTKTSLSQDDSSSESNLYFNDVEGFAKAHMAFYNIYKYLYKKWEKTNGICVFASDEQNYRDRRDDFLELLLKINEFTTVSALEEHINTTGKKKEFLAENYTLFKGTQEYQKLRLDLVNIATEYDMECLKEAAKSFQDYLKQIPSLSGSFDNTLAERFLNIQEKTLSSHDTRTNGYDNNDIELQTLTP